jgi:hypothetical protein
MSISGVTNYARTANSWYLETQDPLGAWTTQGSIVSGQTWSGSDTLKSYSRSATGIIGARLKIVGNNGANPSPTVMIQYIEFDYSIVAGARLSIPAISANTWYIDGSNNVTLNNSGRELVIQVESPAGIYTDSNGPYYALKDGVSGLYLRHSVMKLHLSAFGAGSYDFAFKIIGVGSNTYKLYNAYNGGTYVGYDGANVAIRNDTLATAAIIASDIAIPF